MPPPPDPLTTPPRRTRRIGRPPGVAGQDTHRLILDVAERQFAASGYASTTTKTIAAGCGLSTAAIHHHIGTKPQLYAEVSADVYPAIIKTYRAALDGATGFDDQIARILDTSSEMNARRASLAGFVMSAPVEASRHPELRPIVQEHFSSVEELITELIDGARDTGELAEGTGDEQLVDVVLAIMHGLAHLAFRSDHPDRFARAVSSFQRLLGGTLLHRRR